MMHLAKSVEDTLLAKAFAANRKLIVSLFFYFSIILVTLFLLQANTTPTRHLIWSLGLLEGAVCVVSGCTAIAWPTRVSIITICGFCSGFIFVVISLGVVLFSGEAIDQQTLIILVLFVPLMYMAATMSVYNPLIKISRYGACAVTGVCLIALIRHPSVNDQAVILLLVVAAQPTYFAIQKGLDTIQRIIFQTANESATGKSVMLGMLSHELRTPLQTIRTAADLLKLKAIDNKQESHHLDRILLATKQLEAHLRDLVEFSKLESGLTEVEWVKFDLSELLLGVAEAYTDDAAERNNVIEVNLCQDIDYVIGDPTRVQQVVNNLVSNAVKYTDHGTIEITTARNPSKRDEVIISVRDTGIGIDPSKKESIWKPYLRLKHEKRAEGYGLGLAIVRMLVNMLGGSITLASEVGVGSTFMVRLPMRSA